MKWRGRRGSRNIIDRRRSAAGTVGRISGGGVIAILLVGYFLGIDVTPFLQDTGGIDTAAEVEITPEDEAAGEFVSVALADTEQIWAGIFRNEVGREYEPPKLVLFKGATRSACGGASAASGPFYCPADGMIYLDTDFFVTLERRLGAGGDFAAAYVVAHEVAHAVQDRLGILGQANEIRSQVSTTEANAISVRIELQADCFSGVWARLAGDGLGTLERGDVAEAMNAAAQIGDDTLQYNAGRTVQPHTFTHGTSEQRQRWFARGYESGGIDACDTFGANQL